MDVLRSCHSGSTFGCSCVNPRPGLTTQERSSSGVAAALSPRCPLRLVEHVWKCDDILNTQRSFCDPDVSGHRQSNERVNDLNTGGHIFADENPSRGILFIASLLERQLGEGRDVRRACFYRNKIDLWRKWSIGVIGGGGGGGWGVTSWVSWESWSRASARCEEAKPLIFRFLGTWWKWGARFREPPRAAEIIHLNAGTQRCNKSHVKCVFIANETQTTKHKGACRRSQGERKIWRRTIQFLEKQRR